MPRSDEEYYAAQPTRHFVPGHENETVKVETCDRDMVRRVEHLLVDTDGILFSPERRVIGFIRPLGEREADGYAIDGEIAWPVDKLRALGYSLRGV